MVASVAIKLMSVVVELMSVVMKLMSVVVELMSVAMKLMSVVAKVMSLQVLSNRPANTIQSEMYLSTKLAKTIQSGTYLSNKPATAIPNYQLCIGAKTIPNYQSIDSGIVGHRTTSEIRGAPSPWREPPLHAREGRRTWKFPADDPRSSHTERIVDDVGLCPSGDPFGTL
jgi:hypothetical protein